MAVAIRQAVRRLGGLALQRAGTAPTQAQLGRIYAWKEIKNKKEELFTLIANMECQYDTRLTKAGFQNTRMLQQLAVQIEPRPADPMWRSKRFSKRMNDFVGFTGAVVLGSVIGDKLRGRSDKLADHLELKDNMALAEE